MIKKIYKILLVFFIIILILSFLLPWVYIESGKGIAVKNGLGISIFFKIVFFIYLFLLLMIFFKEKISAILLIWVSFFIIGWDIWFSSSKGWEFFVEIVRVIQGGYILGSGGGYFIFLLSLLSVILLSFLFLFKEKFFIWIIKKWHFYFFTIIVLFLLGLSNIKLSKDNFLYLGFSYYPVILLYLIGSLLLSVFVYYFAYAIKYGEGIIGKVFVKRRMIIRKPKAGKFD